MPAIGSVWDCVNDERCELLLLRAYKDALLYANITDQPPVAKFQLEDEPSYNLDYLQGNRSLLAGGEREVEHDAIASLINNPAIKE